MFTNQRRDYYAEIPESIRALDPGIAQYLADCRRRDDERQRFDEILESYRDKLESDDKKEGAS